MIPCYLMCPTEHWGSGRELHSLKAGITNRLGACATATEATQEGSAVTGACTVPTAAGGFRRAWQRSGQQWDGESLPGLVHAPAPPNHTGTEVGQVTGCAGGRTAHPQPPTQHCQWVQRREPDPAPVSTKAQQLPRRAATGAMQPTRARAISSHRWEAVTVPAEAVAVLRTGQSCCLDLSYKTTSIRDHFKQLCCSLKQSHQCARAPAPVATSAMGARSGQGIRQYLGLLLFSTNQRVNWFKRVIFTIASALACTKSLLSGTDCWEVLQTAKGHP